MLTATAHRAAVPAQRAAFVPTADPLAEGGLVDPLTAVAPPVQRLPAGPVGPVQRLMDGETEITEEMVKTETDIAVLKRWLLLESEEWTDEALKMDIEERIKQLGGGEEEQKIEEKKEVEKGPSPEEILLERIAFLPKYKLKKFLGCCLELTLDPKGVVDTIESNASSTTAFKKGVEAFYDGLPLAGVLRMVAEFQTMRNLTMETVSVEYLKQLFDLGVIWIQKDTYKDNVMHAATVYVFWITGTELRITPEWHVHWGSQNKVSAGSFKDERKAVGEGARVKTKGDQHNVLRQMIGDGWGP